MKVYAIRTLDGHVVKIENEDGRVSLANIWELDIAINTLIEIREEITAEEWVREGQ